MTLLTEEKDIREWLKANYIHNFTLNADLSVNVPANVTISATKQLTHLPIRFHHIEGNFNVYNQKLTTLLGFPKTIGGSLDIHRNCLTSLEHCTQIIGGHFNCSQNKLVSLEGGPQQVGGSYNANNNKLTHLFGAPERIPGSLHINSNLLTSLEGNIKFVDNRILASSNPLNTLKNSPKTKGLSAFKTKITSLDGLDIKDFDRVLTLSHIDNEVVPEIAGFYSNKGGNFSLNLGKEKLNACITKLLLDRSLVFGDPSVDLAVIKSKKIKI